MLIREITDKQFGQQITVEGWVYQLREHGKIAFYTLRDGSGYLQACLKKNVLGDDQFNNALAINREASVKVVGTLREDSRAPNGMELSVDEVEVINPSHPDIDKVVTHDSGPDVQLDYRHLVFRGKKSTILMQYRSNLMKYFREFFYSKGAVEITPPTIVSTVGEAGAELFHMDYYGNEAFLTQSSQFYLESAIFAHRNVFCIMPSYRAEKSRTRRHLAEYTHLEGEYAFMGFEELLDWMEEMMVYVIDQTIKNDQEVLETFEVDIKPLERPFARVTYKEAIELLKKLGHEIEEGEHISDKPERDLVDHFGRPTYLTHFPVEQKTFYHKIDPSNPEVSLSADLLVPGMGELIGSGERETNYENILKRMVAENMAQELIDQYNWYSDLRKYGSVPHSGFGLGIERFLVWLLNVHIRETVLFPRLLNRFTP